jgi:hypothetical protein
MTYHRGIQSISELFDFFIKLGPEIHTIETYAQNGIFSTVSISPEKILVHR